MLDSGSNYPKIFRYAVPILDQKFYGEKYMNVDGEQDLNSLSIKKQYFHGPKQTVWAIVESVPLNNNVSLRIIQFKSYKGLEGELSCGQNFEFNYSTVVTNKNFLRRVNEIKKTISNLKSSENAKRFFNDESKNEIGVGLDQHVAAAETHEPNVNKPAIACIKRNAFGCDLQVEINTHENKIRVSYMHAKSIY